MAATTIDPTTAGTPTGDRRSRGRRARPSGPFGGPSVRLTLVMVLFAAYALLPLAWLVINATKSQTSMFGSFGLWFAGRFSLLDNLHQVLTYDGGIYVRWLANTLLYVVVGAGGATVLATLAGYGLAKYDFPGKRAVFATVLGAVAIPGTALAVPTFLMFSQLHLTNTVWAVIVPSLVSPFGLYLIWVYALDAVPTEILEAARIDGSGELRTFLTIGLRLLTPGVVTVGLFAVVATWNNYFLPLIMLNDPNLFPLTIGLQQWNLRATGINATPIYNLVITGSLLAIVPIVAVFLSLQRYWQSGLAAGSVKA